MANRLIAIIIISMLAAAAMGQSIGIGTPTPQSSAILDISSTDKGMLVPRMTTAQRNAIANPATGLMVYDTNLNNYAYFNGTAWQVMGSAAGPGTIAGHYSISGAVKASLPVLSPVGWDWVISIPSNDMYINLSAGQSIIASGLAVLGTNNAQAATNISVSWGYQRVDENNQPSGFIIPFTGFSFPAVFISPGTRAAVPAAAKVSNLATGRYRIGIIVRNGNLSNISLNSNDFLTGWVMVVN